MQPRIYCPRLVKLINDSRWMRLNSFSDVVRARRHKVSHVWRELRDYQAARPGTQSPCTHAHILRVQSVFAPLSLKRQSSHDDTPTRRAHGNVFSSNR